MASGKKRIDPFSEGSLATIARLFFYKWMKIAPQNRSPDQWLEELFHVDTRTITHYKIVQSFTMPGYILETPIIKIQGTGYRWMPADSYITVRVDTTTPDKIDVEYFGGVGNKEHIYELNAREWINIQRYIAPVKGPKPKRFSIWKHQH